MNKSAHRSIPAETLPNLSPLARDYFSQFSKVAGFFNGDFRDPRAVRDQAVRMTSRDLPRETLAAVLTDQNRRYGCGPETLNNIRRLAVESACTVVTGQQVGLFSGPLYTIYKALTAIKLAERHSRTGPVPFVPVFWLASEDHDLDEIDHVMVLDKDNRPEEVRCRPEGVAREIPATKIIFDSGVTSGIARLAELTHQTDFKPAVLADLAEAYQPGRSYAEAFGRWMTRLFAARGLIIIDASHPDLKALGKDVFRREIAEGSPSTRKALETSQKLAGENYGPQVKLHEGILNLFFAREERRAIQRSDGDFLIKGAEKTVKAEDLAEQALQNPQFFSPNVVLRPIYQDAILPTAAYIGGPGEISYFAQMKGVYEAFGVPMPVIYPRKSVTVLEYHIDKILKEYGLDIPDIWNKAEGLSLEIVKKQIPDSLAEAIGRATADLERDFESIRREITGFEPTLGNSLDTARGKVRRQIGFLEEKILQAAKRKQGIVSDRLDRTVNSLFPSRHLQERVYNIVPYLMKYGYAFLDTLYDAVNIEDFGHQIITP